MNILNGPEFKDSPETPDQAADQSSAHLYRLWQLQFAADEMRSEDSRRYEHDLDTHRWATERYENAVNAQELLDTISRTDDLEVKEVAFGKFFDLVDKINAEFGDGPEEPKDILEDILGIYLAQDVYGGIEGISHKQKSDTKLYISHLLSYVLEEDVDLDPANAFDSEAAHVYVLRSNLDDSNLFAHLSYARDSEATREELEAQHAAIVQKDDDRVFMYDQIPEEFWRKAEFALRAYMELMVRQNGEAVSKETALLLGVTVLDLYRSWVEKEFTEAQEGLTFEMPKPPMSDDAIAEAVAKAVKLVDEDSKKYAQDNLALLQEAAYSEAARDGVDIKR